MEKAKTLASISSAPSFAGVDIWSGASVSERFLWNQLLKLISNFMWKPSAAASILLLQFQGSEQDESRLSKNLTSNWLHIYHIYTEWCGWVMGEHGRLHKINLQSSASRRVGTQNILISTDRSNPIPSIQEMNFKCNSRPTIYQFYCTMWSSYSTELCVWASLKENILRRLPIPQITVTARYNWGKTHFH